LPGPYSGLFAPGEWNLGREQALFRHDATHVKQAQKRNFEGDRPIAR
jgi:hypothetical protein